MRLSSVTNTTTLKNVKWTVKYYHELLRSSMSFWIQLTWNKHYRFVVSISLKRRVVKTYRPVYGCLYNVDSPRRSRQNICQLCMAYCAGALQEWGPKNELSFHTQILSMIAGYLLLSGQYNLILIFHASQNYGYYWTKQLKNIFWKIYW